MKFLFPLSTVLSVTTGNMVAQGGPSEVEALLSCMTWSDVRLGSDEAAAAHETCSAELLEQFPTLARDDLPANPIGTSHTTTDKAMPDEIADWVRSIALILFHDGVRPIPPFGDDPLLPVEPLPDG